MAITNAFLSADIPQSVNGFTTAAFTPSTNKLGIFTVVSVLAGTRNTPTISSTTTGLNFVQVGEIKVAGFGVTVFRSMKPSGLSNGTVTVSFGGQTQDVAGYTFDEFDGVNTTGTDGANAVGNTATNISNGDVNTLTATLPAFGSTNNGTYFAACWQQVTGTFTTFTPTAGFTENLDNVTGASDKQGFQTCWRATNSTACQSTSDSGSGHVAIFALEIVAAGSTFDPSANPVWMPQTPMQNPSVPRMIASGTVSTTRLP